MARTLPLPAAASWYYIILTFPVLILVFFSSTLYNTSIDDLYSLFGKLNIVHVCERPQYTTRIASYSPLIIHLENFITPKERKHLISLG